MSDRGSVLLIDDDDTFRDSTSCLLRREGYECFSAAHGDEAIAALRQRRFDLMIADIRMPGNPDFRVVRAARELDSQMPIVLVTGSPSAETAIHGINLNVAAYIIKPLAFDELLGHVKSAMGHSGNRRALGAICERLRACLTELESLQATSISRTVNGGQCLPMGTIRTLAAGLSELLVLAAPHSNWDPMPNLCELLDCPQLPLHRQAIADTIEILRDTKDAFKCKALADLRTRLEELLGSRSSRRR